MPQPRGRAPAQPGSWGALRGERARPSTPGVHFPAPGPPAALASATPPSRAPGALRAFRGLPPSQRCPPRYQPRRLPAALPEPATPVPRSAGPVRGLREEGGGGWGAGRASPGPRASPRGAPERYPGKSFPFELCLLPSARPHPTCPPRPRELPGLSRGAGSPAGGPGPLHSPPGWVTQKPPQPKPKQERLRASARRRRPPPGLRGMHDPLPQNETSPTLPALKRGLLRDAAGNGSLDLPRSGSAKYRVARNMMPARSWSPPPQIPSRGSVWPRELSKQRSPDSRAALAAQSSAPSSARGNSRVGLSPPPRATPLRAGGGRAGARRFRSEGLRSDPT